MIPTSVASITYGVFTECNSLRDMHCGGLEHIWQDIVAEEGNESPPNATIHYSSDIVASERGGTDAFWELTANGMFALPAKLTTIESEAFAGLTGIDVIEIQDGVAINSDNAFSGTDVIRSVAAGSYAHSRTEGLTGT